MKKTVVFINFILLILFISIFLQACGGDEISDTSSSQSESSQTESSYQASESSEEPESSTDASFEESSENESSKDESSENKSSEDESSDEFSSSAASKDESEEPSKEQSKETSKEQSKEESKEQSKEESNEEPVIQSAAQAEIYGCTKIENNCMVILGTCENGATITAVFGNKTVISQSDHGYFSLRIPYSSIPLNVKITVSLDGKKDSEVLTYKASPKSVSSGQWDLIAGSNYQFHLKYSLNDFLHNNLYSSSQLTNLTTKIKSRIDALKENSLDAEIIYMLVPSPATVYPETMPDIYVPNGKVSRLDQVTDALKAAGAKVIDLKTAMTEHKNDNLKLYWKTDSHWTDYGAFVAYSELFNHIAKKFPNAKPRSYSEFNWIEKYYIGGDISHYLEYYDVNKVVNGKYPNEANMKEWNALRKPKFNVPSEITNIQRYVSEDILTYKAGVMENPYTIRTNRTDLPSVLVMRDSYSSMIFDILAERCNTTIYNGMWDWTYNNKTIRNEKPDYIIYILTERNLDSVFN